MSEWLPQEELLLRLRLASRSSEDLENALYLLCFCWRFDEALNLLLKWRLLLSEDALFLWHLNLAELPIEATRLDALAGYRGVRTDALAIDIAIAEELYAQGSPDFLSVAERFKNSDNPKAIVLRVAYHLNTNSPKLALNAIANFKWPGAKYVEDHCRARLLLMCEEYAAMKDVANASLKTPSMLSMLGDVALQEQNLESVLRIVELLPAESYQREMLQARYFYASGETEKALNILEAMMGDGADFSLTVFYTSVLIASGRGGLAEDVARRGLKRFPASKILLDLAVKALLKQWKFLGIIRLARDFPELASFPKVMNPKGHLAVPRR